MPFTTLSASSADLVLAVSPLNRPCPRLVAAAARGGALGVLDLGAGGRAARAALQRTSRWSPKPFGVRLGERCAVTEAELPPEVDTVLLAPGESARVPEFAGRRVLVEVTDLAGAEEALRAGAAGLIARGSESGGPVGELSSFVLLQQLTSDERIDAPVWACGGIGPHTAAAAVTGGAAGVVLDSQLALLAESDLPAEVAEALGALDGSETTVVHGHRVLLRRGPAAPEPPADRAATVELLAAGELLPVGQDGFLAAYFRDRWATTAAAIGGVVDAIHAALTGDAGIALGADSPAGRALGTRFPVAQGPMTRVSDQAAFAAAVATGGGLPFIALALSGRAQTRDVLEQTRDALGDAPWGVGVLGFAAEETKDAQLEVIRDIRPSHAIIAGGRPAQAAALEEVGIETFLHVPSPGLLKQFLAAGARKFIFEGSECGGHVGPRNSFPLWEAQLGVLAEFLDGKSEDVAREVRVLFAGGVHDERSAAMVAAMAAPMTARGVAIGTLMGTAYLFTEEAVSAGAVLPRFQRQVVEARRTDLLETAPGHATRCVSSPFTVEYAEIKADLRARQVPDRQAWEELERLNVGRLRLASKGIVRVGDELRDVDEPRQLAEGMFMAGDVAVLRSAVTTIADLHASVSSGAAEFLAARTARLRADLGLAGEPAATAAPEPLDIAVVGMSCMYPQAPDVGAFWANVLSGVDAVTEVPAHRWDASVYYAPDGDGTQTPSRWGGFLPEIPFDPLAYGIPPSSLASIEPVQLLALEAANRALADAGYAQRAFDRERTSVVFGAEAGSDLSNATTLRTVLPAYLGEVPAGLDEQLPTLTEDSFPGMLANVIAGRIANRLDLGGANYTVDAACASSLTAVDVACKELTTGTSDFVLCGGADLHNGINDYLLFSSVHALSPSGRSAPFDNAADGIALGEGVACIALKRLADAERDGDRVYAVIKGVGSSSDGRSLGLTAPRPEGQRRALERAYRNAGISPAQVGLVEAHGTGTVVGDRTELATLTEVFSEAGAPAGSCTVGSVKSQIGHTKCAAGLAGMIKSALALHNGVKPPTLHLEQPNAAWDAESSPFAFHTAARPWAAEPGDRVAGVSAFGFGGTNFHVVLQGYDGAPPPEHGLDAWPVELFTFRAADTAAAVRQAEELLETATAGTRLRDLARAGARRSDVLAARGQQVRLAVLAADVAELTALVRRAAAGEHAPADGIFLGEPAGSDATDGQVAFLFPGQGSQRPGMLAELFVAFPELQRYLQLGSRWADVLYPPAAFDQQAREAQQARITDTRVAQPALGMVGLAANELLTRAGVRPDMAGGHSYGELVALAAAGAVDPETLLECSAARAESILGATGEADPGSMAAVSAGAEATAAALSAAELSGVVLANRNSPEQTVISGPTADIEAAVLELREAGLGAKRLAVACAFHSPLVAPAGERFGETLAAASVRAPELPVWSNRTASTYAPDAGGVRAELVAQIGAPVLFVEQIEAMYKAGARIFVEAGPGRILTRLVGAILGDRPHRTIALESRTRSGLAGFLAALAQLAVAGVDLRTEWLFHGRDAVLPAGPGAAKKRRPGWTVDGQLVRTAAGEIPAGALRPAHRVQETIVSNTQHTNGFTPGAQSGPDALIAEFLRSSREMVAAQRDVLLGYLGTDPATRPAAPTVAAIPAAVTPAVTRPENAAPAPDAGSSVAAPVLSAESVLRSVLEIIGERTGYPLDMIEPDLDLEADLSVDSIKRAEIAGELAVRLGLPGGDDSDVEELAKARTAAGVTDLVLRRVGGSAPVETESGPAQHSGDGSGDGSGDANVIAPRRFVLDAVDLPPAGGADLAGRRFLILGGGELAAAVADRLGAAGAAATLADTGAGASGFDGVLHLGAYTADDPLLPEEFPLFQELLAADPRWLVAAAPAGAPQSSGLRGFFRTVVREYPDTLARAVELDPATGVAAGADALVAELGATEPEPVVLLSAEGRRGLRMTATDLGLLGSTGAGPAGEGAAEAAAAGLDRDSVVLLVGGAKGITARFAMTLAAASRCRIELVGRTAVPSREDPATADATDPAALRAALIAGGMRSPADIERAIGRIQAEREVRATLEQLTELGSRVRYHSVDMLDVEAVHGMVKQIHTEHGRLDGLVYAAGVIEDKLIAEKTAESFGRVFDTKVEGARTLLAAVDDLPHGPRFAVLFGSIAAVLGNRGQVDYAAANDALQDLGSRWSAAGRRRGVTVHWGPWAPTGSHNGMVTPELMRSYAKRGIDLIDPEEGTMSLLRELAWGEDSVDAVVYTASGW